MSNLRLVILGSGNGPHCYAGLASSLPDVHVTILSLTQGQRLKSILDNNDFRIKFSDYKPGLDQVFTSKPDVVTDDPSLAIPGCHVIVFMAPACAHARYFQAISPHVKPGMVIVGLPGGAGWHFQAMAVLKEKARECYLMSFSNLPWACEIQEFGKSASIDAAKEHVLGAGFGNASETILGKGPAESLQHTLLDKTLCLVRGHLLADCLSHMNAYIHPSVCYGYWFGWDGEPVDTVPLFYKHVTQLGADMIAGTSDEMMSVKAEILKRRPDVDMSQLRHMRERMYNSYVDTVKDRSTILTMMNTSDVVHGSCKHPMIQTKKGQYMPDFEHRFYTEDIPCGLVVFKGVALILGVKTPDIDKIITWAQKATEKEYLVDGELKGKDIHESRCPQRYEIHTLEGMLGER